MAHLTNLRSTSQQEQTPKPPIHSVYADTGIKHNS